MGDRDPRLCIAHRSDGTGELCGRWAIRGGRVCPMHGGSAGHVREAARLRLLEAVDPALTELLRLALGAEAESVRLRAVIDVLDRVGLREAAEVEYLSDEWLDREIQRLERELEPG